METIIEFKNFKQTHNYIAADLFIGGSFIVRFSDNIQHIIESDSTNLKIYDYFRSAVISYMKAMESSSNEVLFQMSSETH